MQKNGSEKNDPATTYNWTYAYGSTRPHAPTNIGGIPYTYDLNGNQTGFVNPNVTRIISWDEENRIKSISDNGSTATYLYDYNDQRIIKRTSQGETVYLNQFYTVRNGSIYTKHIFAGTERVATRVKTTRDNFVYYYHPDQVGSTNYVTDAAGATYEHMEYFPFGELWVSERSSTEKTPYLFSSKELDEDTKLSYFGARYLDSRTSVWQSADGAFRRGEYLPDMPTEQEERNQLAKNHFGYWKDNLAGMGGVYNSKNLGAYTYGHQNPVKMSDPDGNFIVEAILLGIAFYGGFKMGMAIENLYKSTVEGRDSVVDVQQKSTNANESTHSAMRTGNFSDIELAVRDQQDLSIAKRKGVRETGEVIANSCVVGTSCGGDPPATGIDAIASGVVEIIMDVINFIGNQSGD